MKRLREFELAVACCRWPPGPARVDAVRSVALGIDWSHFGKVARRHRVEPLIAQALTDAAVVPPAEIDARLKREAERTRRFNLLVAVECERIRRLLAKAEIDCLFIKGLTLGRLAYGAIELKKGWDIDLLVEPARFAEAGHVLRSAGYVRTLPSEDVSEELLVLRQTRLKEETWTHGATGVPVELHKALVDNPRLLGGVTLSSPRQSVELAGNVTLETLADEELFAYLCAHGASSAWFRLKWIADLNAFLSRRSESEIERLYEKAVTLGAGRTAAVALLLVEHLFATSLPSGLRHLRRNRMARIGARLALHSMTSGDGAAEPGETISGALAIHLVQALAMPGLAFLGSELKRQAFSPTDQIELPLPRPLRFLYPLLVVPLWLRRRAADRLSALSGRS